VTTTTPEAAAAPLGPNWDQISHDVTCPLCGYNLRGLTNPRCPECGARFDWPDVIDPHKGLHPYLFEHHPERNVRSFVQTLVGTLRPNRFWSSLSPTQPLRPRRMRAYWLLTTLVASLAFWAELTRAIATWWDNSRNWVIVRGPWRPPPPAPLTWHNVVEAAGLAWQRDWILGQTCAQLVFWVAWPWMLLLSLQVFRVSMRRAKVHAAHVLRCVVHSFDVGAWVGLLGVFWVTYLLTLGPPLTTDPGQFQTERAIRAVAFLVLTLGVVTWRMAQAYRRYMRFDHAISTVIAGQVITSLLALNALLAWENWVRHWF
jgi:rubredoxin